MCCWMVDFDYAGDVDKEVSGTLCFHSSGCANSWKVTLQSVLTLSTT